MRILYLVHAFPPKQVGGTELNVYWTANHVAQVHDLLIFARGYDPALPDYHESDEEVGCLKVHRINLSNDQRFFHDKYSDERIANAFDTTVQRFKPDLIHINHIIGLSTEIMRRLRLTGRIPIVLTLRDFFFMCHRVHLFDIEERPCTGPEDGRKCAACIRPDATRDLLGLRSEYAKDILLQNLGQERLEYMLQLLRIPNIILCPSGYLKSRFVEFGIPENRIRIFPSGIDKSFLATLRKPGPHERIRFGFAGTVSPHKGVHTLIDAFMQLQEGAAELQIFGGGDPQYVERLRVKCSGFDVHFNGVYDRGQLAEIFSNIDVLVLPSVSHENYPTVVREAMAAKRPVIVSNLRGQVDLVHNGIDGFHFQVGDPKDLAEKMSRFIREPSLIDKMGENSPPIRDVADQALELLRIYSSLTLA